MARASAAEAKPDIPAGSVNAVFGQRLRAERLRQQITVFNLAVESGVGVASIQRIEKGTQAPSLQVAHQLASALAVSVSALIEEPA